MAMVRSPTTSYWCLNTDPKYSTTRELKRIVNQSSKTFVLKKAIEYMLEVVEDHVHLFLEFHPNISLSKVVQHLKGGSSYRLFKLHPELREKYWGGSLWSSGKFYRSIGNVTADTIKHYINDSQGKPKKEFRSSRIKKSGQLKLSDF